MEVWYVQKYDEGGEKCAEDGHENDEAEFWEVWESVESSLGSSGGQYTGQTC